MKKKFYILILFLVIGFASVTTTLIIKGKTSIAINEADYSIFFSEAVLDDVDKTNVVIDETRQVINYDTKELTLEGEKSILEYEVTNNSKQYDATVKINCMVSDERILEYIDLKYSIDKEIIPAGSKANGTITVELTKAIVDSSMFNNELTCKIDTEAQERNSLVEEGVKARTYYTYGFLVNENNEPIKSAVVSIYANEEAKYAVTDDRGMFIIDNLSSGEYDLYVIENMSLEEVEAKTQEEIISLASQKTNFHTKAASLTFENNYLKYGKVISGDPIVHDITFDSNGGSTESFTSKVIEGQGIGYLPSTTHDSLVFKEWTDSNETINEDTVINEDKIITAHYGEGVAKIGEKQFKTVNLAFEYANPTEETTIEVLKDNSLTNNINTNKNITLNLNEKNINFKDYNITNSGNLTIKNGSIKADGLNVLTNDGTLNLVDNLNIEHVNNINDSKSNSTIINSSENTLNIDNISVTSDFIDYIGKADMLTNYGIATISNSDLVNINTQIQTYEGTTLTINNSNLSKSSDTNSVHMMIISGNCTINGGIYKILENNQTADGLIELLSTGSLTINSGTFDNTHGKTNSIFTLEGSKMNLGENNKEINFIGNKTTSYTIATKGTSNVVAGTLNGTNGHFLHSTGKLTIGSEDSTPTINGPIGYKTLIYRGGTEHKIINGNINGYNAYVIDVQNVNSKLMIDNVSLTQSNSTSTTQAINVLGELIINDGIFKVAEDNQTGYGLMNVQSTGNVTINSGTFDNTYGKGNALYSAANSTMNIGDKDKKINFIGNGTNKYTLSLYGNVNILDGTIDSSNGPFIGSFGKTIIGTDSTTPQINVKGNIAIDIRKGTDNKIINAILNTSNSTALSISDGGKLTIDNISFTQSNSTSANRAINVLGELIINDGTFKVAEDNQTSYGLMNVQSTGNVEINSGTFDNTYGKGNSIYASSESILNIGENNKKVNFIGNGTNNYTITSSGNLNIIDGVVNATNCSFIGGNGKTIIGTETTVPEINVEEGRIIDIRSEKENKIINAKLTNSNNNSIYIYEGAKLTINNVDLTQSNSTRTNRAINVLGELIINGGAFKVAEDNQTSYGLMELRTTGTATIKSGIFDNTYGTGTLFYLEDGTNATIGAIDTNPQFISKDTIIYTSKNSKLTIESGKYTAQGRIITVSGEVNIDGGEFSSTSMENNTIYINETATLNIGKDEKNSISINNMIEGAFPLIANHGYLNIYSGTIKSNTSNLLVQRMGNSSEDEKNYTDEEKLNYASITKIYGGIIENNSGMPTVSITAGRLEMLGGEVVNNGTGRTIYNSGGTAIQTGGISLNNYGVTVQ